MWSPVQPPALYYTAVYSAQANAGTIITGVRTNAYYNSIEGVHTFIDGSTNDAGNIDIAVGNEAIREYLATGTLPTTPYTTANNFGYDYESFKIDDSIDGESSRTYIEVREVIASFDSAGAETALPTIPDPLYLITTPWGPNPITGAYVQYLASTGSFYGWTGQSGGGDWQPHIFGSNLIEPMTAHFMFRDYIDTPTGTPPAQFYQASAGTTLADCYVDPSGGTPVIVNVSLNLVDLSRFSLLVLPGQLVSDTFSFTDYPMPAVGSGSNRTTANFGFITQVLSGQLVPPIYSIYQTPAWRYWIPDTVAPTPPPLRLNQRDDGLGATSGHARMITGQPNGAQSGQFKTAPRLNSGNIYDPGVARL